MRFDESARGLRVLTPAKINLTLEVSDLRPDGFHDIDSIFQCVSLFDEIVFSPDASGEIRLDENGIADGERNLVHRAAVALRDSGLLPAGSRPGVRISLRKEIPQGAGLGGGSSDAAATLVALARLWRLDASLADISAIAATLGSDVPFFLHGGTARCEGRGERVTPLHSEYDPAPPFHYVLVSPGVHAATAAVYRALDEERRSTALTPSSRFSRVPSADSLGRFARGEEFFNRLEATARRLYPELDDIASCLREEPFLAVSMTGSGSSFFGLCRDAGDAEGLRSRVERRLGSRADVRAVHSLAGHRAPWLY